MTSRSRISWKKSKHNDLNRRLLLVLKDLYAEVFQTALRDELPLTVVSPMSRKMHKMTVLIIISSLLLLLLQLLIKFVPEDRRQVSIIHDVEAE